MDTYNDTYKVCSMQRSSVKCDQPLNSVRARQSVALSVSRKSFAAARFPLISHRNWPLNALVCVNKTNESYRMVFYITSHFMSIYYTLSMLIARWLGIQLKNALMNNN